MTALGVLSLCAARGVKLVLEGGDRITLEGPQAARDEVRETIRAVKPEVLALLRGQRQEEVSRAWAAAYGRLESQFSNGLDTSDSIAQPVVTAWNDAETDAEHVSAEYVAGKVQRTDFEAALAAWEGAVTKAIECRATCDDCGRRAVVLVTTDYGSKFCRRCLRPSPLNSPAKGARRDA
jgi:hypothetical protein